MSYALTIMEPWASAIIHGFPFLKGGGRAFKDAENRPWCQSYFRGRFWVHAGKQWYGPDADWIRDELELDVPHATSFAYGAIIGSVELVDIVQDSRSMWAFDGHGNYHWVLRDPRPLDEPIVVSGLQKLWDVERQAAKHRVDLRGLTP